MEVSKSGILLEAPEAFGFAFDFVCLRDFSCVGSPDFGERARGTFFVSFFDFGGVLILLCRMIWRYLLYGICYRLGSGFVDVVIVLVDVIVMLSLLLNVHFFESVVLLVW